VKTDRELVGREGLLDTAKVSVMTCIIATSWVHLQLPPSHDMTVGAKIYIIVLFDKTTVCLSLSTTMGQKTYNSGYSLVVTHLTTNPPVRCLNRAERTGSLVFNVLWSYVEGEVNLSVNILDEEGSDCPQGFHLE
jgi:hypothetical protein